MKEEYTEKEKIERTRGFKVRWDLAIEDAKSAGFTQEQSEYLVELRSHFEEI